MDINQNPIGPDCFRDFEFDHHDLEWQLHLSCPSGLLTQNCWSELFLDAMPNQLRIIEDGPAIYHMLAEMESGP